MSSAFSTKLCKVYGKVVYKSGDEEHAMTSGGLIVRFYGHYYRDNKNAIRLETLTKKDGTFVFYVEPKELRIGKQTDLPPLDANGNESDYFCVGICDKMSVDPRRAVISVITVAAVASSAGTNSSNATAMELV